MKKSQLKGLANTVLNSEASKQSLIATIGNFITSGIMAVAMILLSRHLGPNDFGVFSVSISLMFVISKFADLGLNQLIPRFMGRWFFQKGKNKEFLGHILWWKTLLSILLLIVFLPLTNSIAKLINYSYLDMIRWAIFGSIFIEIYNYTYLVLSAKHKFAQLSVLNIIQALMKATGFFLAIFYLSGNLNGVATAYYLSPAVASFLIAALIKGQLFFKPKQAKKKLKGEINQFWFHAGVGVIMMTLIGNIDVLLIQKSLNSFDTGIYAGATKIAIFISTLSASIGNVLNSRVSRYKDKQTIKKYLKKSSVLVLAAIAGFLLYLPFSKLIIHYTIGPEYISGNLATIILVGNAFLSLILVPLTAVFYTLNKPNYFSINGIIQVIIIVGFTLIFIEEYGIMAAALSRVLATSLSIVYSATSISAALRKK